MPVVMPASMQTSQSYLMDDEKFSRVKTSDGEYLLAFYGRIDGESEENNRIIYLNKYNEIVTDFTISFEVDFKNHDFYFGEKYVMMINRQYSGVDANGNMHGIAIFDTNGNLIANYEPRDPYIFTDVDMFTRFNQTGYSWCETENESIIFNTQFATDDVTYDDKCHRFNIEIGEGDFVYGNVEHTPLCSDYRILEEESTIPGMKKIQIFKDYIL